MENKAKILIGLVVIGIILLIQVTPIKCYLKDKTYCEQDSDCICSGNGCFVGNMRYYNSCVNKDYGCVDLCGGWFQSPVACIENHCTLNYPEPHWIPEDCEKKLQDGDEDARDVCYAKTIEKMANKDFDKAMSICENIKTEWIDTGFARNECYVKVASASIDDKNITRALLACDKLLGGGHGGFVFIIKNISVMTIDECRKAVTITLNKTGEEL